jgi:Virulence factor
VTRYRILSWRGIPAQVKAWGEDGRAHSVLLPDWFQQEIDRRAMEQGLIGSDAYLEHWHWEDADGTLDEVVAALERQWTGT